MKGTWAQGVMVLVVLYLGGAASAAGLRARLSLEYDDNPFEKTSESRRSSWINRLFLYSSGRLLETSWGGLQV